LISGHTQVVDRVTVMRQLGFMRQDDFLITN